jgi:hypothetical protein
MTVVLKSDHGNFSKLEDILHYYLLYYNHATLLAAISAFFWK